MDTAVTIVAFLIGLGIVVYAIRSRALTAMIPFSAGAMEARRHRIAEALENAEQAERRLAQVRSEIEAEVAAAREQADEIVVRARREAVAATEEAERRSRAEVAALLDRARADVALERERAIGELRQQMSELVVEGAGAVLRDALDGSAHDRLVRRSLAAVPPRRGGGGDGR
ncbi:MAG: F0F1 ATP synthase subunit B [Candidatus Dormibacteria bacterium]